jgi:hypothetical protein
MDNDVLCDCIRRIEAVSLTCAEVTREMDYETALLRQAALDGTMTLELLHESLLRVAEIGDTLKHVDMLLLAPAGKA